MELQRNEELLWELLPVNIVVTNKVFSKQLNHVAAARKKKQDKIVSPRNIARSHIAKKTQKKPNMGWHVLARSPHSPDCANTIVIRLVRYTTISSGLPH